MYVNIKKNDDRHVELNFKNIGFIRYLDLENPDRSITVLFFCNEYEMKEVFRFDNKYFHISYISVDEE